jgi:hypothetical protein
MFCEALFFKLVVHVHILSFSLSLFPVAPASEHRASVKRFVSLQFLNPKTVGRTPWTGDQPIARPLPTQENKHRINADISMPWVGFEPTIPVFERAKTVYASDCAAPVIGTTQHSWSANSFKFTPSIFKINVTSTLHNEFMWLYVIFYLSTNKHVIWMAKSFCYLHSKVMGL